MQKRQRRSFTPTSDDGDLVVPLAHNEDTESPTSESAPLIRQAVGFSWTPSISANVSTYQAAVAPQVVPYFLPGQAPPPPPKPKPSKPRAPRKKRDEQYSDQTGKFKLISSTSSPASGTASFAATSPGNSADTGPSSGAARSTVLSHSMMPSAGYAFGYRYPNPNVTAGPTSINGATTSVALDASPPGAKRTRKSSKRKAPASVNGSFRPPSDRPPPKPAPIGTSVTPQYPFNVNPGGPPVERPEQTPDHQRTHSASSCVGRGGTSVGHTNPCRYH